jgi:CHAD domain-containing protein
MKGPAPAPIELARDQPAGSAVRAVLAPELAVWRSARTVLRAGEDVEVLHDARVALRRARTVLRQMRAVLPRSASTDLARRMRWIRSASAEVRDLDILLESLAELGRAGAPRQRGDLALLEERARAERARTGRRFQRALASERCAALAVAWQAFLRSGATGKRARAPLGTVLARRLARRHERVLELRTLTLRSPPEAFHELRIQCKKLRDLADMFRSVLPRKLARGVERDFKRLQAALGDAQDAHVRGRLVRRLAHGALRVAPRWVLADFGARERRARAEGLRCLKAHARGNVRKQLDAWVRKAKRSK